MSLYVRQLAALDKHRGKGQQKITVEHVTVQAGGQAIVGNVDAGAIAAPADAPQLEHSVDVTPLAAPSPEPVASKKTREQ